MKMRDPVNPALESGLQQMTSVSSARTGPAEALRQAYGRIYAAVVRQAALAYVDTLWILGGLCLLSTLLLFFAKKTRPGQAAMGH